MPYVIEARDSQGTLFLYCPQEGNVYGERFTKATHNPELIVYATADLAREAMATLPIRFPLLSGFRVSEAREVSYPVTIRFPSSDVAYTLVVRQDSGYALDIRCGTDGSTTTLFDREDIARTLERLANQIRTQAR